MKRNVIVGIISFLTILLFLYSGINKLLDNEVFKETIAVSPVLHPFAGVIIWLLPVVEFMTAILLLLPKWRLYGFYSALCLMIIFTVYVAVILIFDKQGPCGCGGVIEFLSLKQHLIMNCIFLMLEFIGLSLQKQTRDNNKAIISFTTF